MRAPLPRERVRSSAHSPLGAPWRRTGVQPLADFMPAHWLAIRRRVLTVRRTARPRMPLSDLDVERRQRSGGVGHEMQQPGINVIGSRKLREQLGLGRLGIRVSIR